MHLLELVVAAIFFVGSSGIFFHERFRRNGMLVACAGVIAVVSTLFLFPQVVTFAVSTFVRPPAEQSNAAARRSPSQPETQIAAQDRQQAPASSERPSRSLNTIQTRTNETPPVEVASWSDNSRRTTWSPVPQGTNGARCDPGDQLGYENGELRCRRGAGYQSTENWRPVPPGTNNAYCQGGDELGFLNGELVCRTWNGGSRLGPINGSRDNWQPVPDGTNGAFCTQGGQLGYLNGQLMCRN